MSFSTNANISGLDTKRILFVKQVSGTNRLGKLEISLHFHIKPMWTKLEIAIAFVLIFDVCSDMGKKQCFDR